MKCPKCGFDNLRSAVFCHGCGEKINMDEITPETMAAEKKKKEASENGGAVAKIVRHAVGLVVLLAILGLAAALFLTPDLSKFTEPKEDALKTAADKLDLSGAAGVTILPKQNEFTVDEVNMLFRKRFLDSTEGGGGFYAVKDAQIRIEDGKVVVLLRTKLMDKVPTVFQITGKPQPGDETTPVKFEVEKAQWGYIPFPGKVSSPVISKFAGIVNNVEMKRLFCRSESIDVKENSLVFKFKNGGDMSKEKELFPDEGKTPAAGASAQEAPPPAEVKSAPEPEKAKNPSPRKKKKSKKKSSN